MALDADDLAQIDTRVELGVRRYFDHYLEKVFPVQVRQVLDSHDKSTEAHGGVAKKFDRFRYLLTGFAAAGGFGAGAAATKLASLLH